MIRLLLNSSRLCTTSTALRHVPSIIKPPRLPNNSATFRSLSSAISQASSGQTQGSTLAKDVIVFKYDNPRFFKLMNIFAISQFFFWGYLGHWTYTSLRNTEVSEETKSNEDLSWWRKTNLGEDKYKNTLAIVCFVVAYAVIFVCWTFTLRSVRYIVALKNGKDISLVTYTPFGKNRILNVPINCVSAHDSRRTAKVYLPLKVKNKSLYYILDMKGEFKNTKLFDNSIGVSRKF